MEDVMVLNVLGIEIPVIIDDDKMLQMGADGVYLDQTIYMRSEYPSSEAHDSALVHEIVHAVMDRLGAQMPLSLEEVFAESIGNVIAENFVLYKEAPKDDDEDVLGV